MTDMDKYLKFIITLSNMFNKFDLTKNKKAMKKLILYLFAFAFIIILCSMAWVRINILKPALIVLPAHIKNIAIIDRSLQEETSENKAEEVLTGELFKQDEQAVRQTIEGTIDVCSEFNLYQLIRTYEHLKGGGTKSTFPEPMDWIQVSELCKKHKSDALLSVEIFDSDFIIANPVSIARQVLEGKALSGAGFHVSAVAVINYGVRLYDPYGRIILDEYHVTHRLNYEGNGATPQDAFNHLLNKIEAINQTSYAAGRLYGERISPSYYTAVREFYNRPKRNNDLRTGVRKSEVADWNGAIESWTQALNAKRRIAGRAAFNIAVAFEVLGDLEKAREWAARSYTDYEEKRGNDYYKILDYRIREEAEIKRQVP
jgi:tetratricopeptide (TPR) repeat protein